jgi:DNA-binding NarL/FixJ family response regulator
MHVEKKIPHIIFIDEQESERNKFQRLFMQELLSNSIKITVLLPLQSTEEMLEEILSLHPDALVVDWNLNDIKTDGVDYDVEYSGSDLTKEFLKIRTNFPCFIATSLDEDASKAESTFDVNMIYPKSSGFDETTTREQVLTFKDRILLQIQKYQTSLRQSEERFEDLLHKKRSGDDLTYEEEIEIRKLDAILEAAIDNRAQTPTELKETTNTRRLDSLLTKMSELLERVNKNV